MIADTGSHLRSIMPNATLITRIGYLIFVTQASALFLYLHQYLHTKSRVLVLLFVLRDGHALTPAIDSAPTVVSLTLGVFPLVAASYAEFRKRRCIFTPCNRYVIALQPT